MTGFYMTQPFTENYFQTDSNNISCIIVYWFYMNSYQLEMSVNVLYSSQLGISSWYLDTWLNTTLPRV